MNELVQRFLSRLNSHLTDDQLASLLCQEMPFGSRLIAKQHLLKCWYCRYRKSDLEGRRAERMLHLYRDALDKQELFLEAKPREEFVQRLQWQIQGASMRGWRSMRLPKFLSEFRLLHPAVVASTVFCVTASLSALVWWWHLPPNITSNTLLIRAEKWDTSNLATPDGVVLQSVRITTPQRTVERTIYRPIRGKHSTRNVKLDIQDGQLKSRLTEAGFDWDEPISASSYQGWHDRQHEREDKIIRAGKHLLTLTTRVPEGVVSEQSLTVRDSDFHPVRRTVAFRNSDTVEVAELDFKILPWSGVDAKMFDPALEGAITAPRSSPSAGPLLQMPEMTSEAQLDEAELAARLILNQTDADTGEQIEIDRLPSGIEVRGLVESDERKRVLQARLKTVAHLKVAIQSVSDLKNNPSSSEAINSVQMATMPDKASPLETYLLIKGHNVKATNLFAEQLFDSALKISQESKAIQDLQTRFDSKSPKSVVSSAILSDLRYSHRERLRAAVEEERALLEQVLGASNAEDQLAESKLSLMDAATRNLTLCKELTQTSGLATRSADRILVDMSISVNEITSGLRQTHSSDIVSESSLGGKK